MPEHPWRSVISIKLQSKVNAGLDYNFKPHYYWKSELGVSIENQF